MQIQSSERLKKLPSYAFKEINDKVAALKEAGVRAIDFGVGDPTDPAPEFVQKALTEAAKRHERTGYPSYVGSLDFRQAAADYMKRRFDVELDPVTEISSNLGSKEAIFNFPEGFINPGDVVIIPSPGYPPMKTGTIFAEGVPFYVPLLEENGFLIDFNSIPEEIAQKAKILWLNYPNSPTGTVADRNYYESLIIWAKKYNIILAADEGCYIDIYYEKKPMSILEVAREGIIAFYSLSKRNNMTGYRVGFVAGDKDIVAIFRSLKTNIDSGTPDFIQDAAAAALRDDQHALEMRKIYQKKGEILIEALREIGLEAKMPEATFYIWQKVPAGMSDIEFAGKLLDPAVGIVVTPGSMISDPCETEAGVVNPGEGYVRFALMPTMEEMGEVFGRLQNLKL